jgi:hypothetical protein
MGAGGNHALALFANNLQRYLLGLEIESWGWRLLGRALDQ